MNEANNNSQPLVSVIVITYNSEKTVVETLNSIKAQSYTNLELVISDDCSKDSTYDICKEWSDANLDYFKEIILTGTDNNSGVPGNCNNGVLNSHGEWIKIIAGDDLLEKDCIEKNIEFTLSNKGCRMVFSRSLVFEDRTGEIIGVRPGDTFSCKTNPKSQFEDLLIKDFVNPTTVFIRRDLIYEVGLYNIQYPFMEDYPMWYKILKNGTRIYYNPIVTVRYRVSFTSLSTSVRKGTINLRWLNCYNSFFHDCIKAELLQRKKYLSAFIKQFDLYVKIKYSSSHNKFVFYFYKIIGAVTSRLYDLFVKA